MTYPNEKNPDEDTDLWKDLIKSQVNVETGARFCLFSCYHMEVHRMTSQLEEASLEAPLSFPAKCKLCLFSLFRTDRTSVFILTSPNFTMFSRGTKRSGWGG